MASKIVWTNRATDDLYSVYDTLSAFSDTRAETVTEEIINNIHQLERFPRMGRIVPELNIESIRELLIHRYRVVYSITDATQIQILAVRHSSRPLAAI
ncbi:type II toxin-antitoxin system RelE/ParE family toxin [candidate division KSB1 bacterium]|nr:type II toxin-antitoxin system RelE/ParE family toxin [Lewinellaceae bacterium]MCA9734639.1 type II toxin-antitoxin system RelE/ParE family toxin [candidate division KSB1 bacterium]